jgi:hypothetical protein
MDFTFGSIKEDACYIEIVNPTIDGILCLKKSDISGIVRQGEIVGVITTSGKGENMTCADVKEAMIVYEYLRNVTV